MANAGGCPSKVQRPDMSQTLPRPASWPLDSVAVSMQRNPVLLCKVERILRGVSSVLHGSYPYMQCTNADHPLYPTPMWSPATLSSPTQVYPCMCCQSYGDSYPHRGRPTDMHAPHCTRRSPSASPTCYMLRPFTPVGTRAVERVSLTSVKYPTMFLSFMASEQSASEVSLGLG